MKKVVFFKNSKLKNGKPEEISKIKNQKWENAVFKVQKSKIETVEISKFKNSIIVLFQKSKVQKWFFFKNQKFKDSKIEKIKDSMIEKNVVFKNSMIEFKKSMIENCSKTIIEKHKEKTNNDCLKFPLLSF